MEQKADALFTAIQSSVDDNPFDLSSTVRHVRLAVDTAACQGECCCASGDITAPVVCTLILDNLHGNEQNRSQNMPL